MKQIYRLSLMLLALLLPITTHAHDFEVDGIYYKINGTEATVTYRGSSYDQYDNEYTGDVTIPKTVTYGGTTYSVTSIGSSAFNKCTSLTSINIPNSVTHIGDWAFDGCTGLTTISVASDNPKYDSRNNCNAIIETATNTLFAGCKNTIIPNTVTSIGERAFYSCKSLTSITIPNSVTSIGSFAFFDCSGLTSVTIPNSVTSIGNYAFYGCSGLTSVTIPNSVTSIGERAFSDCSGLTSVTIPNSVTSIGERAFYGCSGLTSVTIPNSVTSIGSNAFSGCSGLTSVTIGNSVTSIGSYAFSDCSGLTSVTIPNSVTSIGSYAFSDCSGLTSVTIGNSVTSIGDWAFYSCESLTSITIPNSVTSIGDAAFEDCTSLTSVTIGNSVTSIGSYAFLGCSGLTSVTIPNSVTFIGYDAFRGCSGLTSVTIPNSVTSIGDYAFSRCSALTECYSYITNPSLVTMGSSVFAKNPSNYADRTLYVPSGSKEAYQANSSWYPYFGSIVEMVPNIPATSIELNKTAAEATVGGTLQLIATVLPDSTTNKVVTWSSSNPTIASVNENGLVTALAVGSATITAITTDGSNLSASCDVTVTEDLSNYYNYLSMEDTTVFHGNTIVIPVVMTNEASIISFQTDIFLPDGLELLQEDGEYIIDPSERMTRTHSIMSNKVSNGAIRVLCYSSNYKPFTGNSGDDLFYLTVKVADDAEGDYTIQLKNTLLTNTDFEEIVAPDVAANVNVKAYLLGDANNSGTVSITDVVVTAQYVLELNPQPFVFEAADANADGNITVADVSRIAWMVLNPTLNAPRRTPALRYNGDHMSGEGVTLAAGETRRVSIMLDNDMDYAAFQLDLTLPEGLMASNFSLTDRAGNHIFDVNTLSNGKTRLLCYSPTLTAIRGNEGAVLTFDVTATTAIDGAILVDGIELVTTDCLTVRLDALAIGVNNTTSVNEIASGKVVARVDYYNLAGQQIDRPENGVTVVVTTYSDGTRTTTKLIR